MIEKPRHIGAFLYQKKYCSGTVNRHGKKISALTYHEFMANQLSKPAYKTWVKDSILVKKDELSYVVFAPNDAFQYDWLETRYDTLIRECISNNFVNNSDSITLSYQLIE